MDAAEILQNVAAAYARLNTLSVEGVIVIESEDYGSHSRIERPYKAFFAAPGKLRIDEGGQRGDAVVIDGVNVHHYFARLKQYGKLPLQGSQQLQPGSFNPEQPVTNSTIFRFQRIAERVVKAEFLRNEQSSEHRPDGLYHVISIHYELPPPPGLALSASPVTVWVHSKTHMVWRLEGEVEYRIPEEEDTRTSRNIIVFTKVAADQPIPSGTFDYNPPEGAVDISRPETGGGPSGTCATNSAVRGSSMRLDGIALSFERRLTISDDRTQLHIEDRVTTPAGSTVRNFTVPLGEGSSASA